MYLLKTLNFKLCYRKEIFKLSFVTSLGGMLSIIYKLKTTWRKRAKRLCDVALLLCCQDKGIILVFAKVKHAVKMAKTQRILQRTSRVILRERIRKGTRGQLNAINESALELHLALATTRAVVDWDLLSQILYSWIDKVFKTMQEKQKRKFEVLLPSVNMRPVRDITTAGVNISSKQVDWAAYSVLRKGLIYATTPAMIHYKDIVCGVEAALVDLPQGEAKEVRSKVVRLLRTAEPIKPNLTREERAALNKLKNDENLVALKGDKDNTVVVMDTDDYY